MPATITAVEMEAAASRVLAALPEPFRSIAQEMVLTVEDFATPDQLAAVGLIDRWQLTGLYEGRPLPDHSVWESGAMPSRIYLFRMPLVAEMRSTRVTLDDLVRHVVVHELGHHFGFSDDDMHALESEPTAIR